MSEEQYIFCQKLIPIIDDIKFVYRKCLEKDKNFHIKKLSGRSILFDIFYKTYTSKKINNNLRSEFLTESGFFFKYNYFIKIMNGKGKFNYLQYILQEDINVSDEIKKIKVNFRNKYILDLILKRENKL